jgi:uncharacterized protein
MRIEQMVEVDKPTKEVWEFVNDVPRVAPCMPGAKLTKVVDDRTYEGTVVVKLGPIRMTYKGTVVMEDLDEASHTATMSASGRDVKGAGTARAKVEAKLEPVGDDATRINVVSDVQLTGKVASFGRGAVQDVANKLFAQFAETATAEGTAQPAATTATTTGTTTGTATDGTASASAKPASRPAPDPEPQPLEAGGLIGTVISGRAKSLMSSIGAFARGLRIRLRERR